MQRLPGQESTKRCLPWVVPAIGFGIAENQHSPPMFLMQHLPADRLQEPPKVGGRDSQRPVKVPQEQRKTSEICARFVASIKAAALNFLLANGGLAQQISLVVARGDLEALRAILPGFFVKECPSWQIEKMARLAAHTTQAHLACSIVQNAAFLTVNIGLA